MKLPICFLLLAVGFARGTKKGWNLDLPTWTKDHNVTDPLFYDDNRFNCYKQSFEKNMECTEIPACLNGWKSYGSSDNETVLERERTYPMLTESEDEIFVGILQSHQPYVCHSACKALRECALDYEAQQTYRCLEEDCKPVTASNMYGKYVTTILSTVYHPITGEVWYHRTHREWQYHCYCYRNARKIRRITERGKHWLDDNYKYAERLRYNAYTCGVSRVTGKQDNEEGKDTHNWMNILDQETRDDLNQKDKDIWDNMVAAYEEQENSF